MNGDEHPTRQDRALTGFLAGALVGLVVWAAAAVLGPGSLGLVCGVAVAVLAYRLDRQ